MPLPFRRGCSDLSGFVGLGSPAIYPLAEEATFVQVSEPRGWAIPRHAAYYFSLSKKRMSPLQHWELCCRLPGAPRGCWTGPASLWRLQTWARCAPGRNQLCSPSACLFFTPPVWAKGTGGCKSCCTGPQLSSKPFALPGQEGSVVKAEARCPKPALGQESFCYRPATQPCLLPRVAELSRAAICFIYLQLCA